jgi:hypothetical protein
MSSLFRQVRNRLFVLASLILLSIFFALPERAASACQECVQLTGGLCVGCMMVSEGHVSCQPDQSTCSCNVGPATCGGKGPGGLE